MFWKFMKRLNKKKAFSHKDQRQDESTTWYFIPDKIYFIRLYFCHQLQIGGQYDKEGTV